MYNEVMSKHVKWALDLNTSSTRSRPVDVDEDDQEESGGSSKRARASDDGEQFISSGAETLSSGCSAIPRPMGRDAAKKKAKGKATEDSSTSEVVSELRALRVTRDNEAEKNESVGKCQT